MNPMRKPKKWWQSRKTGWWAFRNIPVFWLHQRVSYMDRSELIFHLIINIFTTLIIYLMLSLLVFFIDQWQRLLFAAAIARTASYIFNNNFWDGIMRSFPRVKNGGAQRITQYLIDSQRRASRCYSVYAYLVYGSMVRGQWHGKSDIDVRYLRRPGLLNAIATYSFVVRERWITLYLRIPLDSYMGDSERFLDKMRDDEIPIIVKDQDGSMAKRYMGSVGLKEFIENSDFDKIRESKV